MAPNEVESLVRDWLTSERMEIRDQPDERAVSHMLVRYPAGRNGHMFAVVIPKGRDLVAISSMTRVDGGQQKSMKELMNEDDIEWKAWVHECRMQLIASGVDWSVHMGRSGEERPGPLQAFNVSEPIWFDGLTKNELMQTLRRLWLAKLGVIHEIKYTFGAGTGSPGPVDDWEKKGMQGKSSGKSGTGPAKQVEIDETMTFGSGFDPSEWV